LDKAREHVAAKRQQAQNGVKAERDLGTRNPDRSIHQPGDSLKVMSDRRRRRRDRRPRLGKFLAHASFSDGYCYEAISALPDDLGEVSDTARDAITVREQGLFMQMSDQRMISPDQLANPVPPPEKAS